MCMGVYARIPGDVYKHHVCAGTLCLHVYVVSPEAQASNFTYFCRGVRWPVVSTHCAP